MPKDLIPEPMEEFSWDEEHCEESLQKVYAHVVKDAKDAIDWYMKARKPKKYGGLVIRGLAVALVAAAGLLPLISELTGINTGWANPLAASLAVGAAAALVAFDRFFGFSSAWMRFIGAELSLRSALEEFEMDWYVKRATLRGQKPGADQVAEMLTRSKEFVARINTIITEETNAWKQEFESNLNQLDQAVKDAETAAKTRVEAAETAAKAKADATKPGALNVVVKNDKLKTWKLQIGDETPRDYTGTTAAVGSLKPGHHVVRVFAIIGDVNKDVSRTDERVVEVKAGTITTHEVTL